MADITGSHASPKGLRHGFGVRNTLHNVPVGVLAKWMGHASIKTTSIYTDASGEIEREMAARSW